MDSILDHEKDEFGMHDLGGDDFESVPLPNQIPSPIAPAKTQISAHSAPLAAQVEAFKQQLHSAPSAKLSFEKMPEPTLSAQDNVKSRTVQTLLSQNQDLMARLTVALKRNIELEQKIESQEEIYHSLTSQYDILKDQAAVNDEKNKHLEFENQRLYEQSSSIEKRFAELYSAYQDKVNYIQKISYRLHRFIQYRKKIRGYVRPMITKLKAEIVNLKNQILVLNEQGLKQLEYINELKHNYSSAINRIQTITAQNEKTQMDMTMYHETRYQEISRELSALKLESEALQLQNTDLKKSVEAYAENEASLSNKSIFFERKYTDLKNEFEQVSQEFIQQKTADNTRLTNLEIQLRDITSQYAKTSEQKSIYENESRQLNDQLQSIQLIYQDSIEKIEDLKRKNTAQDQINKELSQSLLESRKKAENLEEKLLTAEEEFKRKLQAFQVRFNKAPSESLSIAQAARMNEQSQAGQKDLLNKIQNLLSEIQTGHSQIPNVGFEEAPRQSQAPSELISEFGDIESKT